MADYFVEGGDVLENKLGIADPVELRETEDFCVSEATSRIITAEVSDTFDFDFLKKLHRELFGKIYDFAGRIRTVNTSKPESSTPFCYADFIEAEADRIFSELKAKDYLLETSSESKTDDFAIELADLAAELNALHPFREGNGRTIRLFLQLLARDAGFLLDYSLVPHEEIIAADTAAFHGDFSALRRMYSKITTRI